MVPSANAPAAATAGAIKLREVAAATIARRQVHGRRCGRQRPTRGRRPTDDDAARDLHQAPGLRDGAVAVVLLVGLISYSRLSVREYPRIDEPIVSVETSYSGATAEVIESQITKVLEDSLSGIEGVEVMTSSSAPRARDHRALQAHARPGLRRGGRARQGRPRARAAAGRDRRAGDRQGRGRPSRSCGSHCEPGAASRRSRSPTT